MLYDLTTLQREANTRFGFSARRTLGAAQRLYEEHKALTYPRTNSRYLTSDMVGEIKPIAELVGARAEYRAAAEYVSGSTCCRSGASSTTQGHRPPRDHPDACRAPGRQDGRRRPPRSTTSSCAASSPPSIPRRCSRTPASRRPSPDTSSAPAARSARAGLARRLSTPPLTRSRMRRRRRRRRDRRAAAAASSSRASRSPGDRDRAAGARRPSRRAATATRRCSARWRRPASSSTTRSCARR
jgi:hypothetical protein